MFNFEKFKTAKIAVNVETQEEYDEFMQMCEVEGLVWGNGDKPTSINNFKTHESETCIRYNYENEGIAYCSCKFYEEEGYQIIKFKEIKENEQMTKADLKTGMFGIDREGDVFVVAGNNLVYQCGTYGALNDYNDELCDCDGGEYDNVDIMKICSAHCFNIARINFVNNTCLLFNRTEPTRMTLAEIKQKLGIENLEIVEEKGIN